MTLNVAAIAPRALRSTSDKNLPRTIGIAFGVAVFCLQLAWSISVPPFEGIDEFDHSYRASAVAGGQVWAEPTDATRGTGAVLRVSPDIVDGAHEYCSRLGYTSPADCVGFGRSTDGKVLIASGAGRYNPLYYAVVGWPDRVLDGSASLIAMRVIGSLLAASLFGLCAAILVAGRANRYSLLGLVLALTPVAVYSGSVVAPNGLEIAAGALVWCCLLYLLDRHDSPGAKRVLWAAALGACVLVTLRSMGPLWLLLIFLGWLPLALQRMGFRGLVQTARSSLLQLSAVAITGALSLAWIVSNDSLEIGRQTEPIAEPLRTTVNEVPLWLFQSIAAFPFRNQPARPIVYALVLLVGVPLVLRGFRRGVRGLRMSMAVVFAASIAVPFCVTLATIQDFGTAWQGRYGLALSLGLPILAGWSVAQSPPRHRLSPAFIPIAIGSLFGAYVISLVDVVRLSWEAPILPAIWVVLFAAAGFALWAWSVLRLPEAESLERDLESAP